MSSLMLLEVRLVVGFVGAVAAVVDLLTSMLVSVTEALAALYITLCPDFQVIIKML